MPEESDASAAAVVDVEPLAFDLVHQEGRGSVPSCHAIMANCFWQDCDVKSSTLQGHDDGAATGSEAMKSPCAGTSLTTLATAQPDVPEPTPPQASGNEEVPIASSKEVASEYGAGEGGTLPEDEPSKPVTMQESAVGSDSEPEWTCADCKCPLPWGSDWRQEEDLFYCKPCFNDFDNRWWEFHTRDIMDSGPAPSDEPSEVADSTDVSGPDSTERLQSTSVAGTVLLQLLQPLLRSNLHGESRLSGIDSLAVLTLCRQLRMAVPSLSLRPQDVFQCTTVRDLLSMVEADTGSEVVEAEPESLGDTGVARAIWFAPGQVKSTCKWLYGCRGLLDERCFRRAAAQLIARHEGLRADFEDAAGMELLRFMRDVVPLHIILWQELEKLAAAGPYMPLVRGCRRLVSAALKKSWPRSVPQRVTADFLEDRVWVEHCKSWRDVEQASRRLKQEWEPPFTLALFLLKGDAKPADGAPNGRPEDLAEFCKRICR